MRKTLLVLVLAISVLFIGLSFITYQKSNKVKSDDLRGWINYLASDEMRGRANGSPEMNTAAKWLSEKYREFGIKPILATGEYIQNYSYSSRQRTVNERNVIGVIEGTDSVLKSQYIVLSAHFDHIGVRKNNSVDSIYNGADDNAAGTCTILGIARTLKDSGFKPGRTLIFAAFSGEESGERGSKFFVANSPVNIGSIYADINFEMTGHSEYLGKNKYYMTGCKISNLDNLITTYNLQSDWKLIDTISIAERLFSGSDNFPFSRISSANGVSEGVPSGTFATSTIADYYHSPRDEGKLFDYDNMAGLVNYFSGLVIWLSNNKSEVQFTDPTFTRVK